MRPRKSLDKVGLFTPISPRSNPPNDADLATGYGSRNAAGEGNGIMSEERIAIAIVALVLGAFALVMSGVVGRKVRLVATWSTAVIAVALLAAAAMPSVWLLTGVFLVRAAFPSLIYWGDHDAFKKCAGAIAQPAKWPAVQWQACDVMRMCANEAPLADAERTALYEQLRKLGCEEP